MALSLSLGLSGASEGMVRGSEMPVFSGAGSVGSWGLAGEGVSSEIGFWESGGIVYKQIITKNKIINHPYLGLV
jgi:hypothetical protein